jgi:hypothetical protein
MHKPHKKRLSSPIHSKTKTVITSWSKNKEVGKLFLSKKKITTKREKKGKIK